MVIEAYRQCPLCGYDRVLGKTYPYATRFNEVEFSYLKCGVCKSVYVDPLPDEQTFVRMYAKADYHDAHYSYSDSKSYDESARLLRNHLPRGATVLDYGCGVGLFLKALVKVQLNPIGVEYDADAASFAAENSACTTMTVAHLRKQTGSRKFDALHMGDVLEHLPDPEATLRTLLDFLKPGGILFIEGPLETNPSPVYWSAKLFGQLKRVILPQHVSSDSPTHLFRTGARQQLAFFYRVAPELEPRHWSIYETGWPYAQGGYIKRLIAAVAMLIGGKRVFGVTFGNRFQGIFEYAPLRQTAVTHSSNDQ